MNATQDIADIGRVYDDKFGNLDEVGHMSVLFDPAFGELMQKALDRNSPLTRHEVEEQFGKLGWEE